MQHALSPISYDELTPNCFVVRDRNGQQLAYVYYENEPGRRSAAKLLTKDEESRIKIEVAHDVGATQMLRALHAAPS
jgi:hypothetical protein